MYIYIDSIAGKQNVEFSKLSEIIKYIEDFGHTGEEESYGIVYNGNEPIIGYTSGIDYLVWENLYE